ncbi:hypothetical protein NM208_g7433 [Fusarium decemcellulare]|uniref:Uncharacterized protein n=1 Tax=Fusarium decemcellulare TaxID=57161 RepID=A0ACC1S966_9HYPO|nr:hypothetical protein NM208_g7433 [Fusarium decemcellulare]
MDGRRVETAYRTHISLAPLLLVLTPCKQHRRLCTNGTSILERQSEVPRQARTVGRRPPGADEPIASVSAAGVKTRAEWVRPTLTIQGWYSRNRLISDKTRKIPAPTRAISHGSCRQQRAPAFQLSLSCKRSIVHVRSTLLCKCVPECEVHLPLTLFLERRYAELLQPVCAGVESKLCNRRQFRAVAEGEAFHNPPDRPLRNPSSYPLCRILSLVVCLDSLDPNQANIVSFALTAALAVDSSARRFLNIVPSGGIPSLLLSSRRCPLQLAGSTDEILGSSLGQILHLAHRQIS